VDGVFYIVCGGVLSSSLICLFDFAEVLVYGSQAPLESLGLGDKPEGVLQSLSRCQQSLDLLSIATQGR
jgi:hypothetical protein